MKIENGLSKTDYEKIISSNHCRLMRGSLPEPMRYAMIETTSEDGNLSTTGTIAFMNSDYGIKKPAVIIPAGSNLD